MGEMRSQPWLTAGAIAFLEEMLTPGSRVLEFGAGASTLWLAKRVKELVSVEGDKAWFAAVRAALGQAPHVRLILKSGYDGPPEDYPDDYFDLVLVDGRNRVKCFIASDRVLKAGGYMMLDNSERPRYQACFDFYQYKQRWSYTQTGPDACGFWYPGWTTTWWRK